jgi:cytochrome c biogenesis protein CcmG/thiol:disulfide interchange protein DsbE
MWRYLKFALPALVLIALVALFAKGLFLNPNVVPSPLIGKVAPAFALPELNDPKQSITQAEFQGKVSLFNVWGSWCVACQDEHPALMQFAAEHVIPIYGLDYKDETGAALAMLAKRGDPYATVAFDSSGDTAINWGVYGAPETFLLDKHGVIRHKYIGALTPDLIRSDLMPRIQALKNEKP